MDFSATMVYTDSNYVIGSILGGIPKNLCNNLIPLWKGTVGIVLQHFLYGSLHGFIDRENNIAHPKIYLI
jgi:hypothetical protein